MPRVMAAVRRSGSVSIMAIPNRSKTIMSAPSRFGPTAASRKSLEEAILRPAASNTLLAFRSVARLSLTTVAPVVCPLGISNLLGAIDSWG
jgi:hypothetical protein